MTMNKFKNSAITIVSLMLVIPIFFSNCKTKKTTDAEKIHVIFDTDANNELDDQHALAYLLMNGSSFIVEGVTVNATYNGGAIEGHYLEADRIIKLCNLDKVIPLYKGANSSFDSIKSDLANPTFDGSEAVDFIVERAKAATTYKLVLLAVGKLTNVALAIKKDTSICSNIRIVWLGSNYPESGEYNQDNDTIAMNYILNTNVTFEMVTVRYGKPTGTDAVKVTPEEINQKMPDKGPKVAVAVMGRHEKAFNTFGDYSINLFEHAEYYGNPPSRALFDMAAVAIVKNPAWAKATVIPCPILINNTWTERPDNQRKITVWENFNKIEILSDFFNTMDKYVLCAKAE